MSHAPFAKPKEKKPEYEEPEIVTMPDVPAEVTPTVESEPTQNLVIPEGDTVVGPEIQLRLDRARDLPPVTQEEMSAERHPLLEHAEERYTPMDVIHGPADVPANPEDLVKPEAEVAMPYIGEEVEAPPGSWMYGYKPPPKEKKK